MGSIPVAGAKDKGNSIGVPLIFLILYESNPLNLRQRSKFSVCARHSSPTDKSCAAAIEKNNTQKILYLIDTERF